MVSKPAAPVIGSLVLSVLALSSRFDGRANRLQRRCTPALSVLALSSRFDGHTWVCAGTGRRHLSVLALSSRFDGLKNPPTSPRPGESFSTRSVESF